MLLLLLAMPLALLVMLCMLGRYERLIEAPTRPLLEDETPTAAVPQARSTEVAAELGPDLAPEAA